MDIKPTDEKLKNFELSAILAHEIKNPMNSIIINMEVLRGAILELTKSSESQVAQKAKKYLDVIEDEVRRLDKVIKGFLDFSTPPNTLKTSFQLNETVHGLGEFMGLELRQKNIQLDLKLAAELPRLWGNPDQLRQALLNLIINSMQALPNGGTIAVRTWAESRFIFVSVEDNGIGIDEKIATKIFNPYFTTKAKGSGLGLTIVRRVIKEFKGEMSVQSEKGKGCCFILKLPIDQNPQG
jgi:two-component system, sporulation sensor kinase E